MRNRVKVPTLRPESPSWWLNQMPHFQMPEVRCNEKVLKSVELHLSLSCIQAFPPGFFNFSAAYWFLSCPPTHSQLLSTHGWSWRLWMLKFECWISSYTSNLLDGGCVNSQTAKFYRCIKDKDPLQHFREDFASAQAVRIPFFSFKYLQVTE